MFPSELSRIILHEREQEIEATVRARNLLGRRATPMRPFHLGRRRAPATLDPARGR